MKQILSLLLLLAASTASIGCTSGAQLGSRVDDMWLATKVRSRLASGSLASFRTIDVSVRDGVVILDGWVASEEEKTKVAEMIRPLRGVGEIRNNLSIGEPPPAPASQRPAAAPVPPPGGERTGTTFGGSR